MSGQQNSLTPEQKKFIQEAVERAMTKVIPSIVLAVKSDPDIAMLLAASAHAAER